MIWSREGGAHIQGSGPWLQGRFHAVSGGCDKALAVDLVEGHAPREGELKAVAVHVPAPPICCAGAGTWQINLKRSKDLLRRV